METLLIIIVAILPAALLWAYIWKKDKKKEPTSWLAKATVYGILICFPVALVELLMSSVLFYPTERRDWYLSSYRFWGNDYL